MPRSSSRVRSFSAEDAAEMSSPRLTEPAFLITLCLTLVFASCHCTCRPARRCCEESRPESVPDSLKRRADVNAKGADGATALLWAAHWNDVEMADLLIRAGADANAANDLRMTPLSRACTNRSAAMVERLLSAGASPDTSIATGETPLMTCAGAGSAERSVC